MPETSRRTRRAAVVVFVEAEGVDEIDAARLAVHGLRQAVTGSPIGDMPAEIHLQAFGNDQTVTVVGMMDAGCAAGNGYLWTSVTPRAWREIGREAPDA